MAAQPPNSAAAGQEQPKRTASRSPVGQPDAKRPKYEEMHEWADGEAKGAWIKYDAGGEWIDKFKDRYPDDESFTSLLKLDNEGMNRDITITQMKEDVEPRIGGVVRQIIEKAKKVYKEDVKTFSTTEWKYCPNGHGLGTGTALPLLHLRGQCLHGVVWVQSPPGTGKTSLLQLLETFHGFQYMDVQDEHDITNLDFKGGSVGIDEAQNLTFGEIKHIRSKARNATAVVCAGVSDHELPVCLHHEASPFHTNVCVHCYQYQCCQPTRCLPEKCHYFVTTISALLRVVHTIECKDLLAPREELLNWIRLHNAAKTQHPIPDTEDFLQWLKQITGFHLCFTMSVLRFLVDAKGQQKQTLKQVTALMSNGGWARLTSLPRYPFGVLLPQHTNAVQALLAGRTINFREGQILQKQNICTQENGNWVVPSALHRTLLIRHSHVHDVFSWRTSDDMVCALVGRLTGNALFQHQNDPHTLRNENLINAALSLELCALWPKETYYVGENYLDPGRPDHVCYHDERQLVLEVLLQGRGRGEHISRFNVKYRLNNANTHYILLEFATGGHRTVNMSNAAPDLVYYLVQPNHGPPATWTVYRFQKGHPWQALTPTLTMSARVDKRLPPNANTLDQFHVQKRDLGVPLRSPPIYNAVRPFRPPASSVASSSRPIPIQVEGSFGRLQRPPPPPYPQPSYAPSPYAPSDVPWPIPQAFGAASGGQPPLQGQPPPSVMPFGPYWSQFNSMLTGPQVSWLNCAQLRRNRKSSQRALESLRQTTPDGGRWAAVASCKVMDVVVVDVDMREGAYAWYVGR